MFHVIAALDANNGIGKEGRLPWSLSGDMRFFRELTTCPERLEVETRYRLDLPLRDSHVVTPEELIERMGKTPTLPKPTPTDRNAVLMGRKTWDSLPQSYKPLPNRLNAILSRQPGRRSDGTHMIFPDLDHALRDLHELRADGSVREFYVIGGAEIYATALAHPRCGRVYLTRIDSTFDCDAFMPPLPQGFLEVGCSPYVEEKGLRYRFQVYERPETALVP
jgi:dihydrofolate reductase